MNTTVGIVPKEEIVRLSRKESRQQVDLTKKSTTQLRHDVASLKRKVVQLARQLAILSRKILGMPTAVVKADATKKPTRFSAKGLQAQRSRLGRLKSNVGNYLG